jgi:hypothetical protein
MYKTTQITQPQDEPNTDLLRLQGWSIISAYGLYCMAWKGSQELLLIWRNGSWHKVWGQGTLSSRESLAA